VLAAAPLTVLAAAPLTPCSHSVGCCSSHSAGCCSSHSAAEEEEALEGAEAEEYYLVSHVRLLPALRDERKIINVSPNDYVKQYLKNVEVKYKDQHENYNDDRDEWYKIDVKELVGDTHAPVLSQTYLVELVRNRLGRSSHRGRAAPAGWRAECGTSSQGFGVRPLLAGDGGVALTQNQDGVTPAVEGRYCVLKAGIDAVMLHHPPSAEPLRELLAQDAKLPLRNRKYEDLNLSNPYSSAKDNPSLAGILHQLSAVCSVFNLKCKGRVSADGTSVSALMLAMDPGVYVAYLEDLNGGHGHAVALDTRDKTAPSIRDSAAAQGVLPLTDADLKRCCSGVECVGFYKLVLVHHGKRKPQAALCVDGGGKRARKTTIKREKETESINKRDTKYDK
jgi:hypothetical protein